MRRNRFTGFFGPHQPPPDPALDNDWIDAEADSLEDAKHELARTIAEQTGGRMTVEFDPDIAHEVGAGRFDRSSRGFTFAAFVDQATPEATTTLMIDVDGRRGEVAALLAAGLRQVSAESERIARLLLDGGAT
jgi:hypothetical protein